MLVLISRAVGVIIPVPDEGTLTQFELVLEGKDLETAGLNSDLHIGITVSRSSCFISV